MARNTYDQLGQLVKKGVGGQAGLPALQNVDYAYNIRGWLKTINDVNNIGTIDLFAFKLGYNEGTTPLYNGNISSAQWKTSNTDSSLKTYNYTYDALNRILTATDNTAKFNLTGLSYDKNGNIMGLVRQGQVVENPNLALNFGYGAMDNLVYAYDSGNKLLKVTDNANDTYGFKDGTNVGDDFTYDQNGNMLSDANKGITNIVYSHLNLPTQVTIAGQNILYIYDAVGTKLRKTVNSITTDYAGNYVYENSVLQFFNHAEGYFDVTNTPPSGELEGAYVYQYKDHLGNVRLSYSDVSTTSTPILQIREENNYYPFGLKHKGYNNVVTSTNPALKYKYNGVEYEESLGMNLYEMDVRSYDPAIARFISLDPVTHFSQSTYTAFDNNPIYWADPSGADSQTIYDFNGNPYTVDCNNGECDNAKKQTQETSGADGLTNSQWLEKFRNGFENLSIGDIALRTPKIESNETSKKCNKCFHKINLEKDSPEVILQKFIHNIAYALEKRNQNFRNNTLGKNPYTIDDVLEFTTSYIDRSSGYALLIIREVFTLDDGLSFEIIANLVTEENLVGIEVPNNTDIKKQLVNSEIVRVYYFGLVQRQPQALQRDVDTKGVPALGFRLVVFDKRLLNRVASEIAKEREKIRNSEN